MHGGGGGGAAFYFGESMPIVLAQAKPTGTTTPAAGTAPPQGGIGQLLESPIVPLMLVVVVVWAFSLRSTRKKQKDKQAMIDNMKRGDRVQTIGGIMGTVVEAREKDVIVKVDEGNNTKIKFARGAIDRIVEEEKA
jgi:preprotein translocase subunit YajC